MRWARALVGVGGGIVALGLVASGVGGWQAGRLTSSIRQELAADATGQAPTLTAARLAELPAPVRRHLELSVPLDRPLPTVVEATHVGRLDMGQDSPQWRDFTADQVTHLARPGFDWHAKVAFGPGVSVHVHDTYRHGAGLLDARLLGLVRVAHGTGPDIDDGEMLRLLGEAPLMPSLLANLDWEAVDDHSAWGTLRDGDRTARMLFRFGSDGLITSAWAKERMMQQGKSFVPIPWEGTVHDYRRVHGLLVPSRVEVAWLLPEGRHTYYEADVTVTRVA